ncbi:hypothetical protein C8J57DRAFT_1525569 [Mycena rebaudengoi]|nr:hypothetical protein C8J57DRAFT_1525569 [Mycena rebaudengoi]
MPKGQFNDAQEKILVGYFPEYIQKLDAGLRGLELTKWKQAVASKVLELPEFLDLDCAKNPRPKWFAIIVRKYTNYYHQVYKKDHPEEPSALTIAKENPLLKFSSILSGRQMFARDTHDTILAASRQHIADSGTNQAATYQLVLKGMWDALSTEQKAEWDAKAEDECGDVTLNQKEFGTNIEQALRGLCQGGLVGDAEMLLFYAFREPGTGDLLAGTVHGHSIHNKAHFGDEKLQETYGEPWFKFADNVIPEPAVNSSISIPVGENGVISHFAMQPLEPPNG